MAIQTLQTLKSWFVRGAKPTQQQFGDAFDSFVHKSDMIPQSKIEELSNTLEQIQETTESAIADAIEDVKVNGVSLQKENKSVNINIQQADFAQNDSAALDYIKNRTHYESNALIFELTGGQGSDYLHTDVPIVIGDTIRVEGENWSCESVACGDSYGNVFVTLTNGGTNVGTITYREGISVGCNIGVSGNPAYVANISASKYVLVKLPEKFIPDTIVRQNQIPHNLFDKVVLNGSQNDFVVSGARKIFTFFYDTQKVPTLSQGDLQYFVNGIELFSVSGSGGPGYTSITYGPSGVITGELSYFYVKVYESSSELYGKVEVSLGIDAPAEFDCIIQYKDNVCKKQMDASYIPKEITLSEIVVIEDADVLIGLQPDKEYRFSNNNLSSLTFMLNPSTDSGVSHEYKGSFNTGGTIPSLTLPQNVTWLGGTPTLAANKHYEFSIINGYGVMVEF